MTDSTASSRPSAGADLVERISLTHPRSGDEGDLYAEALSALAACASACTVCADACLSEDDVSSMLECIRVDLLCAAICVATTQAVAGAPEKYSSIIRAQLEACIEACRSCATECEQHAGHHEHCAVCAEACRRCERACQELLAVIDG
jgi:cob(I)alamin adenosyltransferase